MKRKIHALVFSALFFSAFTGYAVNVRDFEAKGDGESDDTAAFQKALDAAFVEYTGTNLPQSLPEVVVPAGTYRLTGTLVFRNALVLRGEGAAILQLNSSDKDLLYGAGRFALISGLTFRGGAHQLRFWTDNMDASCFDIMNCRFENSSRAAVECNCFARRDPARDMKKLERLPPWELKKTDVLYELTPVDLRDAAGFFNSTKLTVEDCTFIDCTEAVDCAADGVTIRRTRVIGGENTLSAFRLGTRAFLYDLDILLKRNEARPQAVVLLKSGILEMTDSIVKSVDGKGIPLVRSLVETPGPYLGGSILLRRIRSCSGNSPENALIYSEFGRVPQILIVQDVTETSGGETAVFRSAVPLDEAELDRSIPSAYLYGNRFVREECFAFSFENNSGLDETLPGILAPFVRKLREKLPSRISFPEMPRFEGEILSAEAFGIGREASPADAENLKKLFDAARRSPGCTVILPGRDIRLSKTLAVPPDIHVTAAGCCHLIGEDPESPVFSVTDPEKVLFSNLVFSGGRNAVKVSAGENRAGLVVLSKCSGYDLTCAAAEVYSGGGKVLESPRLRFYFEGGSWLTPLIYEGNADALIDDLWVENKLHNHRITTPIPASSVVFINFGRLELVDMLGVPLALRKGPRTGIAPEGTIPGDHRWADNHGVMICRHNRFGGEFGGMSTIYHYGKAKTRIYGGSSWYNNDHSHRVLGISDSSDPDFAAVGVIVSPFINYKPAPGLICQASEEKKLIPVAGAVLEDIVPCKKRIPAAGTPLP